MKRWFAKFWHQLSHWEYWNTWLIYLPLAPFWVYYSIKNRSFFFFQKTNPGIYFGGMAMQSKIDIYHLLPKDSYPNTIYIPKDKIEGFDTSRVEQYPIIVKPNEGLKGLGVKVIASEQALKEHLLKVNYNVIIQQKVQFDIELGVFYCRFPTEEKGFITGITEKKMMKIQGDGVLTVFQLIQKVPRYNRQLSALKKTNAAQLNHIPEKGEIVTLQTIGSHTRGAEFTDVTTVFLDQVSTFIHPLAEQIEGFYYGRFDLLCEMDSHSERINNYTVVELNGAMSEPIKMYDPAKSLLAAWREILFHWRLMSTIALQNKNKSVNKIDFFTSLNLIRQNLKLERTLKKELFG